MTEVWTKWEGLVIGDAYALRRLVSGSDRSAVFLTDSKTEEFPNAAIKLMAADPASTELPLAQWRSTALLSHPRVIRLLDSGRCEFDGRLFLFVVMEYAEETLSEILPFRALSPEEVRQMLIPALEGLAFLHGQNLVHGEVKPSNLMVVQDQLKLSSDSIRPSGSVKVSLGEPALYEPPEARSIGFFAAGDMWGLGVSLVEALTRYPPWWPEGLAEAPSLPANLPPEFANIVLRCLSKDPAQRPSVTDLQDEIDPDGKATRADRLRNAARVVSDSSVRSGDPMQAGVAMDPHMAMESQPALGRRLLVPGVLLLGVLFFAAWAGLRVVHVNRVRTASLDTSLSASAGGPSHATNTSSVPGGAAPTGAGSQPAPTGAASARAGSPPASAGTPSVRADSPLAASGTSSERVDSTAAAPAPSSGPAQHPPSPKSPGISEDAVVHREAPAASRSALATIHGTVKVGVLVNVDRSGNVVRASLEHAGPSQYFARRSVEAAQKWKFSPTSNPTPRRWLLKFEFTRASATIHAATFQP